MRRFSFLGLLLPVISFGQTGLYKAASGEEARWSINPHHALIWNNEPYLPFGLRIGASEQEIREAKGAGVHDVVVDCPPTASLMKATVATLEELGLRYILSISTLAPTARGALIEPQGNRFMGITSK